MKILITGSQGMLGQEFLRQLPEAIGCDRDDLDITNEQAVKEKIGQLKPNIIINCAAYNVVDKAEEDATVANLINGTAVGYLAAAAVNCGAVFVHFSSDYVFDGEQDGGYKEDDTPRPISKYGESKLLGEQQILAISQSRKLANFYLIRTSKLFGPPGISEGSKKSFPEMMLGFAREKGRIEAIDAEVGSPTYVKDLVQATLKLFGFPPLRLRGGEEGLRQSYPSGIYHITNSGSCTWYEYAKAAVECAGVQAEVIPVGPERFPRPARRPGRVILLNTKLPKLRSWQEALKEFLYAS